VALLRKMICDLRHLMTLRHPVALIYDTPCTHTMHTHILMLYSLQVHSGICSYTCVYVCVCVCVCMMLFVLTHDTPHTHTTLCTRTYTHTHTHTHTHTRTHTHTHTHHAHTHTYDIPPAHKIVESAHTRSFCTDTRYLHTYTVVCTHKSHYL